MKIFIFLFTCLFFNVKNLENYCITKTPNPTQYEECINIKDDSQKDTQCCFLKEKTEKDEAKRICIAIKNEDALKNETFNKTIYELLDGKYYEKDNPELKDIDELICHNISYHNRSECEWTENPKSFKSCKDKKAELSEEICCYLKGREERDAFNETECVDIKASDLNDLNSAKEKIKEGTYWPSYSYKYAEKLELVCSSKWLSNIISSILICLLLSL